MNPITLQKRPANERGHTDISWLDSWHSFSFGDYIDPEHHAFRVLRVINDDRVLPGHGFPEHPHRDMEILTYVISGELTHRDSMGHTRTVGAGQVQYMSAGTGVTHSEFNASATVPVHLLQIWIIPRARGLKPDYREWSAPKPSRPLTLIASPDGREGSLPIRQDVQMLVGELKAAESVIHPTRPERGVWLQVISGELEVGPERLRAGDGLAIEGATAVEIAAKSAARFLLFDLP
jgi:redox-sensitive bicupin YhaK (pirin superfamily)